MSSVRLPAVIPEAIQLVLPAEWKNSTEQTKEVSFKPTGFFKNTYIFCIDLDEILVNAEKKSIEIYLNFWKFFLKYKIGTEMDTLIMLVSFRLWMTFPWTFFNQM